MSSKINPEKIRESLIRLTSILKDETEILRKREKTKLNHAYEEKLQLLEFLEEQKRLLRANPQAVDKTKIDREDITRVGKELDGALSTHGRELIKAREVNKRVMEAISYALSKHFKEFGIYNKSGVEGQYHIKGESSVPPVKLNQMF